MSVRKQQPAQFSGQQTGPSWPHVIWYWPNETVVEYVASDPNGRIVLNRVSVPAQPKEQQ